MRVSSGVGKRNVSGLRLHIHLSNVFGKGTSIIRMMPIRRRRNQKSQQALSSPNQHLL
jgi:hypothetical protein